MRLTVFCLDFTSSEPVDGCRVTCEVTVAPRFTRTIEIDDDDGSTPLPVLFAAPVDDDDGGPIVTEVPFIAMSRAIELPSRSATTGPTGTVVFDVDVAPAFERLMDDHSNHPNFFDVAVLVRLGGAADGLDRRSVPVLTTTTTDSPTGEVSVRRILLMDFAQTIVGHTTERESRLWFQLHGDRLSYRRYV
jgi:hypothetical protein